ncbi:sigma-54-dependent transcriptional regulator [Catenovulum sp. SX2]|uniref:sigma-54-dependent transcriptional regulator n=1 Tax=Catenovulum sp. SX2 TaxID=3398614 RepID=UPI003F861FB1
MHTNQHNSVVLIVDDQPDNLDVLVNYLADSGLELLVATSGSEALELACERTPDLVLLDVMMPELDGFQVCTQLKVNPNTATTPVIFMSAYSDTARRLEGFKVGAIDFVTKPLQREEVLARIQAHLTIVEQQKLLQAKNQQLEILNAQLTSEIDKRQQAESARDLVDEKFTSLTKREAQHWQIENFVGQSQSVIHLIEEVRSLQFAPNTNVLVLGESGTGKELISRAIHYGSKRATKPFIAVNCSAIPADLADAELFGHIKGAYTGATADRHGYFVQADGGTLFLDEIGDMPLALQAKLLRVLEDGIVTPVGGRKSQKVDVRIVAATNINLQEKVQAKEFRQDLFYRLAGYQISLPALRERTGDVSLLAQKFVSILAEQMGRESCEISVAALNALNRYHFPGNVRELKNMMEYALIASRGQNIDVPHLHFMQPIDDVASEVINNTPTQAIPSPTVSSDLFNNQNQEAMLLEHAKHQGKIDNTSAQQLLQVDHSRASYLLKKLHKEGKLTKKGERRWSYYELA